MGIFRHKKTEGNYEEKKGNPPLLVAVICFGVLFLAFLFYTALRQNTSAQSLRGGVSVTPSAQSNADSTPSALAYCQVFDDNGHPLYDNEGNVLYADEDGNLFSIDENGNRRLVDWEGNPIYDTEGYRMCVDAYGNYYAESVSGVRELRDEYGSAVYDASGRRICLDTYGNAFVFDENGQRVVVLGDGTVVTDLAGNAVILSGTAKDAVYATGRKVRSRLKLAADVSHETIYGASAEVSAAYQTTLHAAAMKTRDALHGAADATGAAVRDGWENATDAAGNALTGAAGAAGGMVDAAGEAAADAGNTWWSFLVNDWNKLKKDLVTPASEFSNGNQPNPPEETQYELFHWGDD